MGTDALFENYGLFLRDHQTELSTPNGAARMMTDEGMFASYVDSLTEGLTGASAATVRKVLDQHRKSMLLTESANVGASGLATGWTVLSFPILVDIYAEPLIAELCNVYPIDKPIASIPRMRLKAKTKSYDGSTTEESYMPTNTKLIRAGVVPVNVTPGTSTNIFTATSLSSDVLKMNRRYTMLTTVVVTETKADSSTSSYTVSVNMRPDNRNQIAQQFTFTGSGSAAVVGTVNAHIDYDKGDIIFNCLFSGGATGSTFVADYATFSLRFTPFNTMNGRTQVSVETQMTDVTVDQGEDFMIDLTDEDMQDYESIYNISLIRLLSEGIKRQVLLNKDFDLAYFLQAAETDMARNGAFQTIDLALYSGAASSAGDYAPNNVLDVLKNVVPRISTLMSTIRRNYNMYPSYLVAGLKTASLLRSLQEMMTNIPNIRGEMGFTGQSAQFLQLKVLESMSVNDSKIYMSTKAPDGALEKSAIIDLIYRPLYVVKEVTNGNTRHFIRSRTMIELARTDGLGCIQINNMNNFVG